VINNKQSHGVCLLAAGAVTLMLADSVQAGPTLEFGEQGSLTFSYAVQGWSQYRSFTSATDDGSQTDMFLRRNRITLSGQYNDTIGFYAQLEAGSDSRGGNDDRSVYYRDAYITLDYSDPLRFIVGRFKNTFSRENLEACLEPLTLDRAEVLSYTPFGGTRDTGVAVWGNLLDAKLQYRLMISDGREGDEVVKDSPRITTRFHYTMLDPEYDYGYRGTYLGTRKVLTFGLAYDYQPDVAYADYPARSDPQDYTAWTADVFYEYPFDFGTVTASAAAFDYDVGDAINQNPDPELTINTQLDGYYAKFGYLFPSHMGPGRLQLFYRHEALDYDTDGPYYDNQWNSIGANYYIDGQRLKVTFEYANVSFEQEHPSIHSLQDYDQATLGLQLIF
jgi:phosphate-selective porin